MEAFAQVWLRIDRLQTHELHQTAYALTIDLGALVPKKICHASVTEVRVLHIDLIDSMHELHILFAFLLLLARTVYARSVHTQQVCLTLHCDLGMVALYHRFPGFQRFI